MLEYKKKQCTICNIEYKPTGKNSKYCLLCRKISYKESQIRGKEAYKIRQGLKQTWGAQKGERNYMYSHGRCVFRRWARERKVLVGLCEHCNKDIKEATQYQWVGHHKDHNPTNNVLENLMLLCKQCHQIEHECWKAFEGVTTISKESRVDNNSKRLTPEMGDDIVCSI